MKSILVAILALLLVNCSMLSAPNKNLIKQKPVIRAGDTSTASRADFVLLIPAGQSYHLGAKLTSDLFEQQGEMTGPFQLTHDLYIYDKWASYDGVRWHPLQSFFDVDIAADMRVEKGLVHFNFKPRIKPPTE